MEDTIYQKGKLREMKSFEKQKRTRFCDKNALKLTLSAIALTGGIIGLNNMGTIKNNMNSYLTSKLEQYEQKRIEKVEPYVLSKKQILADPGRGAEHYAHEQINNNDCARELIEKNRFNKIDLTVYINHLNKKRFIKGQPVITIKEYKCK